MATFKIRIEAEFEITDEDIWNGDPDMPENPTTADVLAIIKEENTSLEELLSEWDWITGLHDKGRIFIDGREVNVISYRYQRGF